METIFCKQIVNCSNLNFCIIPGPLKTYKLFITKNISLQKQNQCEIFISVLKNKLTLNFILVHIFLANILIIC